MWVLLTLVKEIEASLAEIIAKEPRLPDGGRVQWITYLVSLSKDF